MSWAGVIIGGAALISTGVGAYESSQQQGISNTALGMAQQTQANQQWYNNQLMNLLSNPSSFLTNPLFQSTLDVGLQGVDRKAAAEFGPGSGGGSTALESFGQSFASQQLLGQEQLLAGNAGLGFNPASSTGVASNAQANSANTLSGTLASLGFTLGQYQSANQPPPPSNFAGAGGGGSVDTSGNWIPASS